MINRGRENCHGRSEADGSVNEFVPVDERIIGRIRITFANVFSAKCDWTAAVLELLRIRKHSAG